MSDSHNIHSSRFLFPGCGRPLNYVPTNEDPDYVGDLLGNALSGALFEYAMLPMTTLREFTMLQLMDKITDKPEWNIKIHNLEIASKWKEEALASKADLTEKMADWCLEELRYKAALIPEGCPEPPPIIVYNGDVVKSDNALSSEFKSALQAAVSAFEEGIHEGLRDWHPGSDQKVWDLVHPSLFPLVYGRTRILAEGEITTLADCINRCGEGKTLDVPPVNETVENGILEYFALRDNPYSRKFQWLPCEIDISQEKSRVTSYINNLHPLKEKPLYNLIESLIDACIPLWNLTLAPLFHPTFCHQLRVDYTDVDYLPKSEDVSTNTATGDTSGAAKDGDSDGDDEGDEDSDDESDRASVVLPEPDHPFSPLELPPKLNLKEEYGERGLQIIVKLANIELTPENPEYDGGSWHIEGQLNEHIVATALYYYSSSNITTSTLSFRQWFSDQDAIDINYGQDHSAWLPVIYGCERDDPSIQDVGSVETREGRLLTFPNILQHRVDPFKLADPTKPGHRKIVALFLVDPNIKIISTAHVPCQQQEWWWEVSRRGRTPENIRLPHELYDLILDEVDFPFSLQEAKRLREELMGERKEVHARHSEVISRLFTISLCEH